MLTLAIYVRSTNVYCVHILGMTKREKESIAALRSSKPPVEAEEREKERKKGATQSGLLCLPLLMQKHTTAAQKQRAVDVLRACTQHSGPCEREKRSR